MNDILRTAARETAAVEHSWSFGGSNRYPAETPSRPRPKPEPKPEPEAIVEDEPMSAFDEALEHCCWCRERGMSPQDVAESIQSRHVPHTWGAAIDLVERQIINMRRK